MSKSGKHYEFPPPLAGMAQASYTDSKGLTSGVAPFDATDRATDRFNLPQQLSLFYGGRIYDRAGAFVQATYDGTSDSIFLDLTDVRYANDTLLLGKNLIYGLTINNSPSVQDVWNTTSAWGFPYASSGVAASPAVGTVIDGYVKMNPAGRPGAPMPRNAAEAFTPFSG